MAYLASKRNKFLIKPEGATDIRVDMVSEEKGPRIWLQCAACGDEMLESTRQDLFECPECGHEISFKEVDLLGQKYATVLCDRFGLPSGYKKKGLLWRFLGWFGSKKRLPAPKS